MRQVSKRRRERGEGLFIIILIAAGLAAFGMTLLTLTSMGPKISGGLREHEEAFNAAEAGFNAAWETIENNLGSGAWVSFAGHTLSDPNNIHLPFIGSNPNPNYFRRRTDEEILASFDTANDGTADVSPLLYFRQKFALNEAGATDIRLEYTAFLIDDEAGGGAADPRDAMLVVIGVVRSSIRILSTTRLEIVLALQ